MRKHAAEHAVSASEPEHPAGATLTLGGLPATPIAVTNGLITATIPHHPGGVVDVVRYPLDDGFVDVARTPVTVR